MPSTLTESSYIFTDKYSTGLYINDTDEGDGIMDAKYALRLKICKCLENTLRIFLVVILLSGIIGLFTYILIKYVF
jgi:hypothetical protein